VEGDRLYAGLSPEDTHSRSPIAHKAAAFIKDFIRLKRRYHLIVTMLTLKRRQVQSVGEKAVREGNLPEPPPCGGSLRPWGVASNDWRFWGAAENVTTFLTTPYNSRPASLLNYDCI
jgi:hypothetical protein